jgi:hypothetical protein
LYPKVSNTGEKCIVTAIKRLNVNVIEHLGIVVRIDERMKRKSIIFAEVLGVSASQSKREGGEM